MEFINKVHIDDKLGFFQSVEAPNEGEPESKEYWAITECIRVINSLPTVSVDMDEKSNRQDLLEMAQMIKSYCEEHDIDECSQCVFCQGHGYKSCMLSGEPEVWQINEG